MIKIRKYHSDDWERLCEIHDKARKDELEGSVDLDAFKTLEDTFENEGLFDGEVFVAEFEGEVNGFISFEKSEITWLYVDPKNYGKGLGSLLLKTSLSHCDKKVEVEVLHNNARSIAFYEKHGFRIVKKMEGVLEGNEKYKATAYLMRIENNDLNESQN